MKTSRIVGIVAAATLAAGTVTGATMALAADNGSGSGNGGSQSQNQDDRPAAPDRGMGGQGDHGQRGPGGKGGPRGEMGGPRGEMGGPRGEMGGHMLHSEVVIEDADGNYVTIRMQSGEVTAVSATSISVKSADGYTSTYVITDATEQDRDRTADTQAKVGDTVRVRATVDGSTATAEDIHAMSADFAAQMEERRAQMEEQRGEKGNHGPDHDHNEDGTDADGAAQQS